MLELQENERIIAKFKPFHSDAHKLNEFFQKYVEPKDYKCLSLERGKYKVSVYLTDIYYGKAYASPKIGYLTAEDLILALENLPEGLTKENFSYRVITVDDE